jgi:uncharacterized protein (DUF924 family)
MTRDLGTATGEVHRAEEVRRFWLEETPAELRFARDAALDAQIVARFAGLRDAVLASHAAGWRGDPHTLLAAVILLDQFSRNIHRGSAKAFGADPLARALTREALAHRWGEGMSAVERQFLYMPLMHSEALSDQLAGLALFEADGKNGIVADFARRHAAQIARFGRFPQRNAPLGRATTEAEAELLSQPDQQF